MGWGGTLRWLLTGRRPHQIIKTNSDGPRPTEAPLQLALAFRSAEDSLMPNVALRYR